MYQTLERLKYEVLIDAHKHRAAHNWCEETFGEKWNPLDNRNGVWAMYWAGTRIQDKYQFRFTNEHDLLWFKIKWI